MTRKLTILWVAVAALVAGAAQARPPHAPHEGKVDGTITALSSTNQTITITPDRAGAPITLQVTAATRIKLHDHEEAPADFSSLAVGQHVKAKYDPGTMVATKLDVDDEPEDRKVHATGRVISVTPATTSGPGQVMLDLNGDTTPDLTLTMDATTQVRLDHLTLTGDQVSLLRGLVVEVEYGQTSLIARKIETRIPAAELLSVIGQVAAVDTTAGTLTVQPATGAPVTVRVLPGVSIKLNNHAVTLAQIQVGQTAQVDYVRNADGVNLALSVRATTPPPPRPVSVDGTLTAVDTAAGTFTLSTRRGTIVLTLVPGADVRINNLHNATLADLAAALQTAQAGGRVVKVKAKYIVIGTVNQAFEVRANAHGRALGHGHD